MFDASYDSIVVALFWFLTGAVAASWGEFALRKWESKRREENWVNLSFEFNDNQLEIKDQVGIESATVLDGTLMPSLKPSDPKISRYSHAIIVVFKSDIEDPCLYVSSSRKVIWRELKSNAHHLIIEVDRISKDDVVFGIIARPRKWWGSWNSDAALKWHDAAIVSREVAKARTFSNPSLQSPLGIEAGTRP